MKLYIKACSSYRDDLENIDVKKELKQKYKVDTRRKDSFIHLALLGAMRLQDEVDFNKNDELYITSGVGNIEIIERANEIVNINNDLIRPYDFLNMIGNTTSYYVASALNLSGKNIFQISDNFTFINSLISIYASINVSKKNVILGSVDLVSKKDKVINKILDVDVDVVNGSNFQYLSSSKKDTIAELEFDTKIYSFDEIKKLVDNADVKTVFSLRCKNIEHNKQDSFFETMVSFIVNQSIQKQENLLYIDCFEDKYKVLKLCYF